MLFDLRGRGRRRTVQVIYLALAILMGGGLVLFGIGGGTNGGLFDAIGGSGGNSTNVDAVFQKRLDTYEARPQGQPAGRRGPHRDDQAARRQREHRRELQPDPAGLHGEGPRGAAPGLRGLAALPRDQARQARRRHRQRHDAGLRARSASSSTTRPSRHWRWSSPAARRRRTSMPSSRSWPRGPNRTARARWPRRRPSTLTPKAQRKQLKSAIDLQKSQLGVEQPTQPQSG